MNPWFRPSIQQPRWIANTVKSIFSPLTNTLNYVKVYLETWNEVCKPTRKDDEK